MSGDRQQIYGSFIKYLNFKSRIISVLGDCLAATMIGKNWYTHANLDFTLFDYKNIYSRIDAL